LTQLVFFWVASRQVRVFLSQYFIVPHRPGPGLAVALLAAPVALFVPAMG
jgi:hypothetical protein